MSDSVFHFKEGEENFETYACENGFTFWSGLKLMDLLGYSNWATFNHVVSKAMTTCNTLGIPIMDNFQQRRVDVGGRQVEDFKLSRFACYLISMNGNVTMPKVAQAQAYFARLAGAVQDFQIQSANVERLQVRSEISDREKTLTGVAFSHGLNIDGYGLFQNAGYRGMYNKNISQLKAIRNVDSSRSLLDFMGKNELAANLFRITQTEIKIKAENVRGQSRLENTAENVGQQVRKAMLEINNTPPERLGVFEDIKEVKKNLKSTNKALKGIDKPKKAVKKQTQKIIIKD